MATSPETVEFILEKLGGTGFSVRRMFGEYALYASGKTVAFVCDDILYVKILPASAALESFCEKGEAYPGSKLYYVVTEELLDSEDLPGILHEIAKTIPAKKAKAAKKRSQKKVRH